MMIKHESSYWEQGGESSAVVEVHVVSSVPSTSPPLYNCPFLDKGPPPSYEEAIDPNGKSSYNSLLF